MPGQFCTLAIYYCLMVNFPEVCHFGQLISTGKTFCVQKLRNFLTLIQIWPAHFIVQHMWCTLYTVFTVPSAVKGNTE